VCDSSYYCGLCESVTVNLLKCRCVSRILGEEIRLYIIRCDDQIDHAITPHWLEVPERIQFRLGVLAYRCLHNTALAYLTKSLQLVRDVEDSMTLVVHATRCSTLGDRAFPVSATRTWNSLPPALRAASSRASFRQKLKTLFAESFPDT